MTGTLPLSVAIITKNEEKRLPDCLKSVSFADEIVIVDSGSTDKTPDIAREFGCRFFVEEWKGYGPQKNSAAQKCNNEWVLIIDADESVPEEARQKIAETLRSPSADAYSVKRKNFFNGKWIRHCGWWPDRVVRLVRKSKGSFQQSIHERWVTDGAVENLDAIIEHRSFDSYSAMLRKLDEYSTATAQQLFNAGKSTNALAPLIHGMSTFVRLYILKKGALDGFDGLVISLTNAGGSFFKYAKLLELQRKDEK